MCLWVPARAIPRCFSPRRFLNTPKPPPPRARRSSEALADARADGIKIVQVILEPSDAAGENRLRRRRPGTPGESRLHGTPHRFFAARRRQQLELPPECRLETYRPETHDFFRTAIEASYEGTLDCPALAGMREMEDVIEGHKGVGVFDPALWSVLLLDSKPAGCLLLAEIPSRRALETVYLGLAPEAQGQRTRTPPMKRVLAIGVRAAF